MHQDDGTPLGETLRRALALYVEVARNQEMGGHAEARRLDGQELHVTLL
ncbi:hypothetical protein GCM10025867_46130 (plasmid) [Frondihabitans sucicola]|uniref:Uncharacterized protein n=1 Tax=Frondihabitans sucicola TaxID=1268041 RepID=A0ABN6Y4W2_9MICO|nr:hypothetical protein [Frondihabitans sucicola]BDZ52372.1 hypothetical protein GCM10025867_46130 [Frondihabitans sucicola]